MARQKGWFSQKAPAITTNNRKRNAAERWRFVKSRSIRFIEYSLLKFPCSVKPTVTFKPDTNGPAVSMHGRGFASHEHAAPLVPLALLTSLTAMLQRCAEIRSVLGWSCFV